jgi:hypothetical protein
MPKAKQLTVSCENRPGTLVQIARVLGDTKVNILAFVTTTSGAEGSTCRRQREQSEEGLGRSRALILRGGCAAH